MKILFVCLGNICRSVAAEGVLQAMIREQGRENDFIVDSAGLIDYHEGELADQRMRAAARRRGIELTHRSRPIRHDDFYDFDLIVAMDADNIRRLDRIRPRNDDRAARITLASEFFSRQWPEGCVPDPYYEPDQAFDYCLDQLDDVCRVILARY